MNHNSESIFQTLSQNLLKVENVQFSSQEIRFVKLAEIEKIVHRRLQAWIQNFSKPFSVDQVLVFPNSTKII